MNSKPVAILVKKNQFKDEIDRYFKLLPPFMKIEQLELSISKRSKQKAVQKNLEEESIKILSHVDPSDYLISMDEKGKQIDIQQISYQWRISYCQVRNQKNKIILWKKLKKKNL